MKVTLRHALDREILVVHDHEMVQITPRLGEQQLVAWHAGAWVIELSDPWHPYTEDDLPVSFETIPVM